MVFRMWRLELRRERGHPADDHRRLDPVVQRRQVNRAQAADRQADAADPRRIHLRPGDEIVHGADVVPEHHARPGETGGEDGPAQELFVFAGALVEGRDPLGRDAAGPLAPVSRVVVEQHPSLAPVEHVDDDHHVPGARQLGGDALAAVGLSLELGQDRVLVSRSTIFSLPQK